MKVLYFVHTFEEQNGISIHLKNLIKNLPKDINFKVIFGKEAGIPFFSSLRIPFWQFFAALNEDFDIIHVHGYGNFYSFFGAVIALIKNKPLVWTIHGYPQIKGLRRIFYYFFRYFMAPLIFFKASKIISVSREAIKLLQKETHKQIVFIPNGIDVDFFKPKKNYKQANNICFIGRLDEDKNPHRLFECKSFPLLFVGPNEGNVLQNLMTKAEKTDAKASFISVPYDQMPDVYQKCRYVVLPSKYEGFPLTLLESIASERPFICTDVGENKKILSLLFTNHDQFLLNGNLEEKIKELESRNLSLQLAKARKKLSFFSWKHIAKQTVKLYKSI